GSADQGQGAGGSDTELSQQSSILLESCLLAPIGRYQRLAGGVHPVNRGVFTSRIVGERVAPSLPISFQQRPRGRVGLLIKSHQVKRIERGDLVQLPDQRF